MKEVACQFGAQRHLSGILTLPGGVARPQRAMILVSAGLTPKAGPYRLYTELARTIAQQGVACLRFDLGGIGDSEAVDVGLRLAERTNADIAAAVDVVTQHGATRLMIGGLCSGAEDAFRYAATDPRIRGVFMVDPHAFRTPGWYWRHALSRHPLKAAVEGGRRLLVPSLPRGRGRSRAEPEGSLVDYRYLGRAEAARVLDLLMTRGVSVHYIYTADRSEAFNHARQFADMFGDVRPDENVTVAHFPGLEHTQLLAEDRASIVRNICNWAARDGHRTAEGNVSVPADDLEARELPAHSAR